MTTKRSQTIRLTLQNLNIFFSFLVATGREGLEPAPPESESDVLPNKLKGNKHIVGFEPTPHRVAVCCLSNLAICAKVGRVGLEPT